MNKRNLTLKDISKIAGVSTTTVSNVLNNKGRVSEEVKRKINKIVKEIGYESNLIAKTLKMKKSKIVGVLIPDILSEHYFQVIEGIEEIAKQKGYTLLISNYSYKKEEEILQVRKLRRLYVDGLIILGGYKGIDYLVEEIGNIPAVLVDREINNNYYSQVQVNNKEAFQESIDFLYKLGHRDIGYFGYNFTNELTNVELRKTGFYQGLKDNGLKVDKNKIIFDYLKSPLRGIDAIFEYIKANFCKIKELPTAFMTQTDYFAIALIKYLRKINIRVPKDISVMGFGNILISNYVYPSLTTRDQPKQMLGTTSIKMLIKIIEGDKDKKEKKYLDTKLIERESTAKIKNN